MKLTIVALVTLSFSTLATAGTVTLDYRATDPSCMDAARFADEVSAKLGFVPWDPAARLSVRVRVERDGDHFTGTFRNADGSAKVIDGTTCPEVTASLAVTAAAALDRNAPIVKVAVAPAPAAPAPAMADDGKLPIKFTSSDGGHIDVSLNTGTAYGVASNGAQIAAASFSNLCTSPCTARLQTGRSYLLFTDPEADAIGGENFRFDQPTTITLTHQSRHGLRRNLFIAGLAVSALSAYALDVGFSDVSGNATAITLGTVGLSVGLTALILPLWIHDTFSFSSAPGT
jgi:hypothetical protein